MKVKPIVLLVLGLAAMLAAILIPLEGLTLVILGCLLSALGARAAKHPARKKLYLALLLVWLGSVAMYVLTQLGGTGGASPMALSNGWLLLALPYPIGWLLGLIFTFVVLLQTLQSNDEV